jgi:hypothetical protein
MARKALPESTAQMARIAELELLCAEHYQVIGALADHADCFDHPDVQRALDNAAKARLVHRDLLPWPRQRLGLRRARKSKTKSGNDPSAKTAAAIAELKAGGGRVHRGTGKQIVDAILRGDKLVRREGLTGPK